MPIGLQVEDYTIRLKKNPNTLGHLLQILILNQAQQGLMTTAYNFSKKLSKHVNANTDDYSHKSALV